MAYGTANVDNIQSSTAGTPVVFKDGGGTQIGTLCRAWVNFNGSGSAVIRASFNVSSVTYNSTGNYTVNFTSAFADASYGFTVAASSPGTSDGFATLATSSPTTSALRFRAFQYNGSTLTDQTYCSVAIFR